MRPDAVNTDPTWQHAGCHIGDKRQWLCWCLRCVLDGHGAVVVWAPFMRTADTRESASPIAELGRTRRTSLGIPKLSARPRTAANGVRFHAYDLQLLLSSHMHAAGPKQQTGSLLPLPNWLPNHWHFIRSLFSRIFCNVGGWAAALMSTVVLQEQAYTDPKAPTSCMLHVADSE